MFEIWFYIAGL